MSSCARAETTPSASTSPPRRTPLPGERSSVDPPHRQHGPARRRHPVRLLRRRARHQRDGADVAGPAAASRRLERQRAAGAPRSARRAARRRSCSCSASSSASVGVVLLFGLLINSCAGSSRKDSYSSYMGDVQQIGGAVDGERQAVRERADDAGHLGDRRSSRSSAASPRPEQQNVNRAQGLDTPGRLRDENGHLVDALVAARRPACSGWPTRSSRPPRARAATTRRSTPTRPCSPAQASRLVASDVVWDDLFRARALAQLTHDGVEGVTVPESHFVADPDLTTAAGMKLVLQRLRAGRAATRRG